MLLSLFLFDTESFCRFEWIISACFFEEASNVRDLMGSAGVIEEWLFLNACQTIRRSFTEALQSALTIVLDGDIVFSLVDQES